MPRGKRIPDTTTAHVKALLMLGEGVCEVSRQLKVPHSTVSGVKATLSPGEFDQVRREKGEQLENLLVDYLEASLRTLREQVLIVGERAYIQKQPAGELAALHSTISEKTFRLLEAIHRTRDAEPR